MSFPRAPLLFVLLFFTALQEGRADSFAVSAERLFFTGNIDGNITTLEAMLYRPEGSERRPLVIFSHGRDGLNPPRNPNEVYGNPTLCQSLAGKGFIVVYLVRRGYGNSDGPDTELQETAILSGMEAVKSYRAAIDYWSTQEFVLPHQIVLMGQSQGGWAVLTCTNVDLPGVLGVVNISGGTNFRTSMDDLNARNTQWVQSCRILGAGARVPSFWIYAENDLSIPGPIARNMFNAFTSSGGQATLLMLPPFGTNGHQIVGTPSLFSAPLDQFFTGLGFVTPPAAFPAVSISGPNLAVRGGTLLLTAEVTGNPTPSLLNWRKDGQTLGESGRITGVHTAALSVIDVQGVDAGRYSLTAANSAGVGYSKEMVVSVIDEPVQVPVADGNTATHIVNLSARGVVGTGENALIAGFIVSGAEPKTLLIVASGLTLRRFDLTGEIGRPHISIHQTVNGSDFILGENSDWQVNRGEILSAMVSIGGQPPENSSDSGHGDAALVISVPPGGYTAVVSPDQKSANQDGICLVELTDLSSESDSHLINISARGLAETGDRQMIVGVVTRGPSPSRLLIRAVGPTLRKFGIRQALANPAQSFSRSEPNSPALGSNEDWWLSPQTDQLQVLMPKMGLFPLDPNSADSALLALVEPGAYTSIVGQRDGSSGVVLTEIYDANGF